MRPENPDSSQVLGANAVFEKENRLAEDALAFLFQAYPNNTEPIQVMLKVTALDRLYNTNVPDLIAMAEHIVGLGGLDPMLESGDPRAVDLIRTGGRRNEYSFATKYCSWHQPDKYAIFDSNVEWCLYTYGFCSSEAKELRDYQHFLKVLADFRHKFGLAAFSPKELDKFLHLKGREIREQRALQAKEQPEKLGKQLNTAGEKDAEPNE